MIFLYRGEKGDFSKYADVSGATVFKANSDTFQPAVINLTRVVVASRVR